VFKIGKGKNNPKCQRKYNLTKIYRFFFYKTRLSCRKTLRKCTVTELFAKGGGKTDCKGIMITGGDYHFCEGKWF
jgi:hypothetical protein